MGNEAVWAERLGTVRLSPQEPVVAGSMMQWELTYTAGSMGVDEGGTIMLVQRLASDMPPPQFHDPEGPSYTTVSCDARCRLEYRFQPKQYIRPWMKWCLVMDVVDGFIKPGETVSVVLGDKSKGSPGIRAQSFAESAHEFIWLVDPTNAVWPVRLPNSPTFPVVADKAVKLVCIAPSQMTIGETKELFVKGEDVWSNPTPPPAGLKLSLQGDAKAELRDGRITAREPGVLRVMAEAGGLKACSNPIEIAPRTTKLRPYWGDLHAQTNNTVGTGSFEEYFAFARDWARADFVGHQGNDFQVTPEAWQKLDQVMQKFHEPGRMVVFPGYEWSGNTSSGGDHNVIYLNNGEPIFRSSHWEVPQVPEDGLSPAITLGELFPRLRKYAGPALVIPHVGGRPADTSLYFDPEFTPVVEIVSCHGIFEWLLFDALAQGRKVGVVCNSDGHKGRPGAEGPGTGSFGVKGGLTCILAEEFTRKAFFEALKARRCYGTTGARMNLSLDAGGHMMGEEFQAIAPVRIKASVTGTAPIEKLQIMLTDQVVHEVKPPEFSGLQDSGRIRVTWQGARIRGRARRVIWNGGIKLEGARIKDARTVSFDSPAEGITEWSATGLQFKSCTVGDMDGIDLYLDQSASGRLSFESPVGRAMVDLAELGDEAAVFDFGGVGMKLEIKRYPQEPASQSLDLSFTVEPPQRGYAAYLAKAIQVDGEMAWSSPVFISRP